MNAPKPILLAIEEISVHGESMRECSARDALAKIYRLLHTHNSIKCRANHPEWTKEYKEVLAKVRP